MSTGQPTAEDLAFFRTDADCFLDLLEEQEGAKAIVDLCEEIISS